MTNGPALPELFFIIPFIFMGLIALAMTAFWVWMLVDCATNEPSETNDKIIWILVILFGHGLGAIVYYFARRPTRIAQYGR